MRENRPSGSEGGAGANPLFLPLSNPKCQNENCWIVRPLDLCFLLRPLTLVFVYDDVSAGRLLAPSLRRARRERR
jgi:hypothetical protein